MTLERKNHSPSISLDGKRQVNFHKMKVVSIFLTILVTVCMSLQFPVLKPQHYYVPIINSGGATQSILYSKENNNDVLISSILGDLYTNQSVVLLSGDNVATKSIHNKAPNIILLTEHLNIEDFTTEAFKTVLVSYWSHLYLVITTSNENCACKNGTLDKYAFAETKNYLNELWQVFRIVRVIVSFPYTCPEHYVIYDGKEWSGTEVYNRSIRLIKFKNIKEFSNAVVNSGLTRDLTEDYPLRANFFYRFPTSIRECGVVDHYTKLNVDSNTKLCGLDGDSMNDYIKHYKFNLIITTDESCDKYGFVDHDNNNVTTGSLGCILEQRIDISFNSRFMWLYSRKNFYYLYFVYQDEMCAIMKRPDRIPLWHYAGNIFTPFIWIVLLANLCLLGAVAWLLAKISAMFSDERPLKLRSYLFNTLHSALVGVLLNNDGRFLIIKGTSLLCSVILIAVYQGHINYQFTTRSHYPEIKTLKQLFDSSVVLYTSPSIMDILKYGVDLNNPNQAAFLKRIQLRNTTATDYVIDHPNTATVARRQDVMVEALKDYMDQYGVPQIYVIDECFQTFFLSFIARTGYLFIEESQKFMMRLLEAGLPNRYYIWTRRTYNLADSDPGIGPETRPFKKIRLQQLRTAFGVLVVGYVISGLIFIGEKWKGRNMTSFRNS